MRIEGQLIGLFSFDVGYEIDLRHAGRLVAPPEPAEPERRRPAPQHLSEVAAPLRVPLGTHAVHVRLAGEQATASARIHDFGAVTIVLAVPLACEARELPALTSTLIGADPPLELLARELVDELEPRLRSAIRKPLRNAFVEDYYVLQVDRIRPAVPVASLLAEARGPLASALRCEDSPLSEAEIDEVFRTRISYYPEDLVVTEWNVALVIDPTSYADALNVLEHLNVQLLELRYYDDLLDRRTDATYDLATRTARSWPLVHRPYRHAVEELAAIRLEVANVIERVNNALKLSGDLYLAKIYARTAERLGLPAWESSVQNKLDVLDRLYEVLVERARTARSEALESTIVLLIVLEIVLFLAGVGA